MIIYNTSDWFFQGISSQPTIIKQKSKWDIPNHLTLPYFYVADRY